MTTEAPTMYTLSKDMMAKASEITSLVWQVSKLRHDLLHMNLGGRICPDDLPEYRETEAALETAYGRLKIARVQMSSIEEQVQQLGEEAARRSADRRASARLAR